MAVPLNGSGAVGISGRKHKARLEPRLALLSAVLPKECGQAGEFSRWMAPC